MGVEKELAIMFSDVVGSTQLYEKLGDDVARGTVQGVVDQMKQATVENNGIVIKTMGDEVMATFDSVQDAMDAHMPAERVELREPCPKCNVGGDLLKTHVIISFPEVRVCNSFDIFGGG